MAVLNEVIEGLKEFAFQDESLSIQSAERTVNEDDGSVGYNIELPDAVTVTVSGYNSENAAFLAALSEAVNLLD